MPTDDQLTKLKEDCTWTSNYGGSGINGYTVSSKESGNSNYIFLPTAGHCDNGSLSNTNYGGYYWSRSLYSYSPNEAWHVRFNSDEFLRDYNRRCIGFSVRPVLQN